MRLVQLNVHPLKSGAIRPVSSTTVLPRGLTDDRSWMLVDGDGRLVSAREVHRLFHVVADTPSTDPSVTAALRLRAPGHADLLVDVPRAAPVGVHLFSLDLQARPAGAAADAWVRAVLRRDDLRLVWCHDPEQRTLQPGFSQPGDHAAFPDSFPVTIASLASMRRLDDWIVERALELGEEPPAPLPVERFRANLVVDGDEPFGEDRWSRVVVGDVPFRVGKPVGRCVMATIDPATLRTSKEPTRTLARHRLVGGKTLFAVHLVPETSGRVSVGDEVRAE
ncbi:molybdenum cofactor biosysynthesis protein [Nocardioides flavus (ex Wang et al. 2016)]|uniref:Molybdenum cofactor biosysynthesis protein n=1 Tax=Nocardioides flavus (ex Wang et al. 2016) TaxID=2058780 RepID=A0ABQ3HP38_9ACTN|nr:MOSC N-terminal beta barrel domain-containing protein [Nocardioides flavus (ex Wang et al. 2016)]GHE19448.1 molybdenum cofactor biosysynthesis protein [Nocardioides flavus (ex Wang et al. 2016)]